jgi:hypothetical protein
MAMEEATAAMVAAEEPVAMTTALDAVAMAGPDDSGGGCPDVVRSDTWGAPDTTLDPKAMGKTHVSMIGSGGSRPPPPPHQHFHSARWYLTHLLQIFPCFILTLCPGFLTLARML